MPDRAGYPSLRNQSDCELGDVELRGEVDKISKLAIDSLRAQYVSSVLPSDSLRAGETDTVKYIYEARI
jgi:hypothetical protein